MDNLQTVLNKVYAEELTALRDVYRKKFIGAGPDDREKVANQLFNEELPKLTETLQHKTLKLRLDDYNKAIANAKNQQEQEALAAQFVDEVCQIKVYELKQG